ncbi:hypothetical protein CRG98_041099 [Punica granatum]|uniref:MULE transposase domain-containing protein n=1 Tax=Punica granatum TaxID=22663 RepID=A0A2I0I3H2_PUNGR|nr:hypothetical protein CRG98_041099 [Punica granatum]
MQYKILPLLLGIILDGGGLVVTVDLYYNEHTCARASRHRQASYKWLAKHYLEKFSENTDWGVMEMLTNLDHQFAIKTHMGGQLLSAIRCDGNNQMFPIAWAIVEGKNQDSWTWFLKRLAAELGITEGFGVTIISDQQKKKKHNGYAMKSLFWRAVKSITEADFRDCLDEMRAISLAAAQDFTNVGVEKFCSLYINVVPSCEVVDNNMSKCFNGYISKARTKPLIEMLEGIRTLRAKFQVVHGMNKFVVDVETKTYGCRM